MVLQNEIKALQRQVNMINKTTNLTTNIHLTNGGPLTLQLLLLKMDHRKIAWSCTSLQRPLLIYGKQFYFLGSQQTRELDVINY